MRNWLPITAMLAAVIGCSSLCGSASACNGSGYGGFGYGLGFLYNSLDSKVPYFAAHPPVYYSYPVPRTYGHSPFAYPPHFRTPEVVEASAPLEIINPYVPSSTTKPAPQADETVEAKPQTPPLVIENPYFDARPTILQVAH